MNAAAQQAPGGAITVAEQIASVIREIGMRKHVYPGWVAKGKMKQDKADHELAAMESALVSLRDYQAMQPKVLALTAVSLALARGLKISPTAFDEMLVKAEADAVHQMGGAPTPPVTLIVDDPVVTAKEVAARAWPFPAGKRP